MDTEVYWVGQVPGRPMIITVLDSDGDAVNLNGYTTVRLRMLDTDNNSVDLPEALTTVADANNGRVLFSWPEKSIFTEAGEYVLQLELRTPTSRNFTSVQPIIVKEFGGVRT